MYCGTNHLILYRCNVFKKNGIAYWTQALAYTMWVLDRSICFWRLGEWFHRLLWSLSFMSAFSSKVFYSPNLIYLQGAEEEIRGPLWNVIYMAVLITEKACTRWFSHQQSVDWESNQLCLPWSTEQARKMLKLKGNLVSQTWDFY